VFLSNRGIVAANESNVRVISTNINPFIINALEREGVDNAVAFSYNADENYYISMLKENALNEDDTIVYVYNAKNGTWVTSDAVFDNAIYYKNRMIITLDDSLFEERKDRLTTDFADSLNVTCSITKKISDFTIEVDDSSIEVGDGLFNNDEFLIVSNVINQSTTTSTIRLTSIVETEAGATFRIDKKITSRLLTSPISMRQINLNKNFSEMQLNFRNDISCTNMKVSFRNDLVISNETELGFSDQIGWGLESWSTSRWASISNLNREYFTSPSSLFRTLVSRECIRSSFLQIDLIHDRIEAIELQNINLKVAGKSGSRKTR